MARTTTYVTLMGEIIRETEKALLMKVHLVTDPVSGAEVGDPEHGSHWFPLSQIESISRASPSNQSDLDSISVAEWLVRKNEAIRLDN